MRSFILSAASALLLPCVALAAPLGLPIFTTAPSTISIVNEFDPNANTPTPYYTLTVDTVIASAHGAPDLVGQSLRFVYFSEGGIAPSTPYAFSIGGVELLFDPIGPGSFLISPPYTEPTLGTFVYDDPFSGFGPRTATFPEIELAFSINAPLPTETQYLYCLVMGPDCMLSPTPGLADPMNGMSSAYRLERTFIYPEGEITDGTITFSTVGGRVIPLPATLPMLLAALGGLVSLRRLARASAA